MAAIIQLLSTIKIISRNLSRQRAYIGKNIQPILSEAAAHNDGSLDTDDFKKITHYYGLAVPAILGEAFCALHDKEMNSTERIAATAQGAMTGLFDDFFDKQYLSGDMIEKILAEDLDPNNKSNEKLFGTFYRSALQNVPDKKEMQDALMEVHQAQLESKNQTRSSITTREIEEITWYKGGSSLLFYRTAFLPQPSTEEKNLLHNLGSLMQLSNDIFDVYKDREAGVKTLVTETGNIQAIRILLQQKLGEYYRQAYAIGLKKEHVRSFLSVLSLGIFSRAFVCLDQLEQNEKLSNNKFDVHAYSRKQLICDMDTWSNKMRSARYHIELSAISY